MYSEVTSIRGIRLVLFIAELNGLESWEIDVGNAHLEAFSKDKFYIVAGHEFRPLEGYYLITEKTLYRLRTSDLR